MRWRASWSKRWFRTEHCSRCRQQECGHPNIFTSQFPCNSECPLFVPNLNILLSILFRLLCVLSLFISLVAFVAALCFLHRGLPGDTTGSIASSLIALVFGTAAFFGFKRTRSAIVPIIIASSSEVRSLPSGTVPVAALLGLISLFGSVSFFREAAIRINREYPGWFPVRSVESFGDVARKTMTWLEFVQMGVILGTAGCFLLWFVGRVFFRRVRQVPADPRHDDGNPCSAPTIEPADQ